MPLKKNIDYKNFLEIQVFNEFKSTDVVDTDSAVARFFDSISHFDDDEFCEVLIFSGYIPDLYEPDGSHETLYSKFCEILVSSWATRIGLSALPVKTKGSYEDVTIKIRGKTVVCDVKSFRLGRSQAAPNVKDFLKLEDIRKWLGRYSDKLGGLVVYPDKHEWKSGSDAYRYCSDKTVPTVMLPYKYLAAILHFKNRFSVFELERLWDFDRLFPAQLTDKSENKSFYWRVINREIISILGISCKEFQSYISYADMKMLNYLQSLLVHYNSLKNTIKSAIEREIDSYNLETMKKQLISMKVESETKKYDVILERIKKFRLC